jgi:hypothetical protein
MNEHSNGGRIAHDFTGLRIAPDPKRTWRHALRNQWNIIKGCACAGLVSQGGVHSICLAFAGVSGAGASSVSRFISQVFNGQGLIGLTAAETLQYFVAPALAVPVSYGVDRLRGSGYSLPKAGVAVAISAAVAVGIAYQWPHQHDADMAVKWFDGQSEGSKIKIRQFARDTGQSINDVALGMCSSDPIIMSEMERLKRPAYIRVGQYFKLTP